MSDRDNDPTYVTKSFLPPREEYDALLDEIWARDQLTNGGPLTKRFEEEVCKYLDIDVVNFNFLANGTLALQLALDALGIDSGEVITTPFTYVATTSALLWQRCSPVYVDIDPETLTIDATKIEAAITDKTRAILAVHVFGNPCDVEAIQDIADRHDLKVIYDAAHAFGVRYKGRSILEYGDASTLSFHATKLFHTIEGGAVYCRNKRVSDVIELSKRFGHNGDDHIRLGINAKANEFQAAMGIANLRYIDSNIQKRKLLHELYTEAVNGRYDTPVLRKGAEHNYSYYPVLFKTEAELLDMVARMNQVNIHPRRYFYPSLNDLAYVNSKRACPVSDSIAPRILCLPFYPDIEPNITEKIVGLIR